MRWTSYHLLEHIQYEFLEDLTDAKGQGVMVRGPAEVTRPYQFDQLPSSQAVLLQVQLQLAVCKFLLTAPAPHGFHQPLQEVFDLKR